MTMRLVNSDLHTPRPFHHIGIVHRMRLQRQRRCPPWWRARRSSGEGRSAVSRWNAVAPQRQVEKLHDELPDFIWRVQRRPVTTALDSMHVRLWQCLPDAGCVSQWKDVVLFTPNDQYWHANTVQL